MRGGGGRGIHKYQPNINTIKKRILQLDEIKRNKFERTSLPPLSPGLKIGDCRESIGFPNMIEKAPPPLQPSLVYISTKSNFPQHQAGCGGPFRALIGRRWMVATGDWSGCGGPAPGRLVPPLYYPGNPGSTMPTLLWSGQLEKQHWQLIIFNIDRERGLLIQSEPYRATRTSNCGNHSSC